MVGAMESCMHGRLFRATVSSCTPHRICFLFYGWYVVTRRQLRRPEGSCGVEQVGRSVGRARQHVGIQHAVCHVSVAGCTNACARWCG